jgi:hypothetical protein
MQILRVFTAGTALLLAAATAFAQVPKANWDLEDHAAEAGPFYQLGAVGAIPPGRGVVEGGDIPYKPEALARRKENGANRWKNDPAVKCCMPGIPRAAFPLTSKPSYEIFEYACNEGNYAMRNRLSAARALEAKDAAKDAAGKK